MTIELGMGTTIQKVEIPKRNLQDILLPNKVRYGLTGEAEVRRALEHPIGSRRLGQIVKPGEKIVLITSDMTRPMPSKVVLPEILRELYEAGVSPEQITIVFALGSHRPHTEEEMKGLVGEEIYGQICCADSDPSDCVCMGKTAHGTPVDITRIVAEADRRICLGNIEYHYFAGYSGGAKAIMPGVSTRAAIQANHRMMTDPAACAGNISGNPLRKDIEEAAELCRVDFILNVVLDEHKKIIFAAAGDVTEAHRAGCAFLDRLYQKEIKKQADIVVVSQGGAPKDVNLYQTQKALDNAAHAVRDGGTIILVGSCREGLGERTFEQWMTEARQPEDLLVRIRKEFRLGGHKAAAIAMVLARARIYLVSELPHELTRKLFMIPFDTVQDAFEDVMRTYGPDASVIVMPYGGSTLPKVTGSESRAGGQG